MSVLPLGKIAEKMNEPLPPLENGDQLDQKTFHERYEAMPGHVRAELIGGIVYVASPVTSVHSEEHATLIGWLAVYKFATPGLHLHDNPTVILGSAGEPQPDAVLRRADGGTKVIMRNDKPYISGPPELVAEVSFSTESIDMHRKRNDYDKYGVGEYIAFLVRSRQVTWLARQGANFAELQPDGDGILRSKIFPGLWLDPAALLKGDTVRLLEVLNQGMASEEHAAFVLELKKNRPV